MAAVSISGIAASHTHTHGLVGITAPICPAHFLAVFRTHRHLLIASLALQRMVNKVHHFKISLSQLAAFLVLLFEVILFLAQPLFQDGMLLIFIHPSFLLRRFALLRRSGSAGSAPERES